MLLETVWSKRILDEKVIVRSQTIAENGDIVAMTEDNEATVKRFYKETRYRLQPENSSMNPIYLNQVSVLGKVVGLFREM